MSKHTELPWDCDTDDIGTWVNSHRHPQPIAKMGRFTNFEAKANAAFIVRACNSHYELLEALRLARNHIQHIEHLVIVDAAISKAEATT